MSKRLTKSEAVAKLNELADNPGDDPERTHGTADDVLLAYVPEDVREAYQAVVDASLWWACA